MYVLRYNCAIAPQIAGESVTLEGPRNLPAVLDSQVTDAAMGDTTLRTTGYFHTRLPIRDAPVDISKL